MNNKLKRSESDKMLLGVCGGFAEYFGIDSTLIRCIWAGMCLLGGTGLALYFVFAVIMPKGN